MAMIFNQEVSGLDFDWGAVDASKPLRGVLDEITKSSERKIIRDEVAAEKDRAFAFSMERARLDDEYKAKVFTEQVLGNRNQETANAIAQEDRHALAVMARENQKQVTANATEALTIKDAAQQLKKSEFEEKQIEDVAAGLLAKSTAYLLSIKDPVIRQEEANRIRNEFSTDKSNKAGVLAGQKLFDETNRLVNNTRNANLKDMDLALTQLADADTAETKRTEIGKAWELNPRPSMRLSKSGIEGKIVNGEIEPIAVLGDVTPTEADKRNVMTIGKKGEKADNIYDIAIYAANIRPASKMENIANTVLPKSRTANMGQIRLDDRMLSVKSETEAVKLETLVAGTVADLTAAINGSTGATKRRLNKELIEFKRLTDNGTRSTAMKRKIKDYMEATKDLVYTPSNILKP